MLCLHVTSTADVSPTEVSPLLVFANKMDMPSVMTVPEVVDVLGLRHITDRPWFVQGYALLDGGGDDDRSCALTGDGLDDGFTWLANAIEKCKKMKSGKPSVTPPIQS